MCALVCVHACMSARECASAWMYASVCTGGSQRTALCVILRVLPISLKTGPLIDQELTNQARLSVSKLHPHPSSGIRSMLFEPLYYPRNVAVTSVSSQSPSAQGFAVIWELPVC